VAVLIVFGVVMPVVASLGFHTVGIPQDDDWSYRHIAANFDHTGRLVFDGWNSMTLVGQIVLSWPFLRIFGVHGWVFTGIGALAGMVAIAAAYVLARHLLSRRWAWAAVAILLVVPGFAWSTATFMTDVPALAAELCCLALGIGALTRRGRSRWTYLSGALLVGVVGFSIREFAFAAPAAVLLCVAAGDRQRWRTYAGIGAIVVATCGAVYLWTMSIPGNQPSTIGRPTHLSVLHLVALYFEIALLLSPAVFLSSWRRRNGLTSRQVAVGVVTLLGGIGVMHYGLFLGDFLNQQGLFGTVVMVGGRALVLPDPVWDFLRLAGLVSGIFLAMLMASVEWARLRDWRSWPLDRPVGLISVFACLCGVGLVGYGLTVSSMFDRYAWPLVFVSGVLLLRDCQRHAATRASRAAVPVAICLGGILFAVSAVLTLNAYSYSAARWQAGQTAVAAGVPSTSVDAGFEWVGAHARTNADTSLHPVVPSYELWYGSMEPGFRQCAVVTGSPLVAQTMHLVRTTHYQLYGFAVPTPLFIYVSSAPGCRSTGK
jgi:4-amino-4-deoxy-L-arabinose transferase-like glycosyltransferase